MKSKKTLLLLLTLAIFGSACSTKKQTEVIGEETAKEEEALLLVDNYEADELFELDGQALDFENTMEEEPLFAEEPMAPVQEMAPAMSSPMITSTNSYTVVEGDTLMYIAYKMYGDYRMWKSIADLNGMNGSTAVLRKGDVINVDASRVRPMPFIDGTPYLIRSGDTLGKISNEQYGTTQRWEDLWKHNAEMIRDPNIIFAGFQMYLLPDGSVAYN